ncbi:MAG: hypothetical protein AAF328_06920 [Planctomycetota bacterium]
MSTTPPASSAGGKRESASPAAKSVGQEISPAIHTKLHVLTELIAV